MPTETLTRTVPIELEVSNRKRDRIEEAIDRWQEVARYTAEVMPSYDPSLWGSTKNYPRFYRTLKREFPNNNSLHSAVFQSALDTVGDSFHSWRENGMEGDRPLGEWGDASYMVFKSRNIKLDKNDGVFGARLALEPWAYRRHDEGHEWFRFLASDYERQTLEQIVDGDYTEGASELRVDVDGTVRLHLTYSEEIDVAEEDDVDYVVGVDLGERVLYSVVVRDEDGIVEHVELEDGAEFRHKREQFDQRRDHHQENGNLGAVKKMKGQRLRYTDQVCHTASCRIADIAAEYDPAAIALEDLTNYREDANDPIHDWPFAQLQKNISYKATERGLPVTMIDPRNTSTTCRSCGTTDGRSRDGADFVCEHCGYEVHADVNGAMNIAQRGWEALDA